MSISIYNNSSTNLAVELRDGLLPWEAGTEITFEGRELDKLEWVHEEKYYTPILKVKSQEQSVIYRFMSFDIPYAYIGDTNGQLVHRFQMEEDGQLYLVKPDQKFPADIKSQPPGFPISPHQRKSRGQTRKSRGQTR